MTNSNMSNEATNPEGEAPDPVADWLRSMGMERHAALFRENRVKPEHLEGLTDADLSAMGIAALGDRRAILAGVAALHGTKEQAEAQARDAGKEERLRAINHWCLRAGAAVCAAGVLLGLAASISEGDISYVVFMLLMAPLACLAAYAFSLPAILAFRNAHEHRWAILVANYTLGFTGILWIILILYSSGLIGSGAALALGYFLDRD